MKLTFLGTGTSCGVPVIGCPCKVCTSNDPRDRRLRTAAMIETDSTRVLIDCGPDFREQMLKQPFRKIDGIFLTHIHYDHCGGIDDLRPFCIFGDINIHSNAAVVAGLRQTVPYCFAENKYPGVPRISVHEYRNHETIQVGDIPVTVFTVNHGQLPISAFRIGKLAYITDMKTIDDAELPYLEGTEVLVVNALRYSPGHNTHLQVDEAIEFSRRIKAKTTYFIHMCHDIGLHAETDARLPEGFHLAYDGMTLDFD